MNLENINIIFVSEVENIFTCFLYIKWISYMLLKTSTQRVSSVIKHNLKVKRNGNVNDNEILPIIIESNRF